jgi:hypothetical protein
MTSPGSSGSTADSLATRAGTENTRSEVRPFCIASPLMLQPSARSSRSSNSSGVTSQGPVGLNPGKDLPMLNCGTGPAIWTERSERSCPTVRPAT